MKTRKKRRKLLKNQNGIASPLEGVVAFGTAIAILLFFYIGINTFFAEYEENSVEISAKTVGISEKSICGPGLADGWNMDWHEETDLLGLTDFGLGVTDEFLEYTCDDEGNLQVSQFRLSGTLQQLESIPVNPPPDIIESGIWQWINGESVYIRDLTLFLEWPDYEIPVFDTMIRYTLTPSESGDSFFLRLQSLEDFPYAILHAGKIEKLSGFLPIDKDHQNNLDTYAVIKEAIGLESYIDFTLEITQIDGIQILDYGKVPEQWQTKESFSRIVFVQEYESKEGVYIPIGGEIAELVMTIYQ